MPAKLEAYRSKRNFKQTSEPAGELVKRRKSSKSVGGLFVIHKHDARRLHYDLRLEHNGVLWSWAVTRGPSLDPGQKRLSVHVEDHPLDYADFEGTIPEGSYGAGTVIVWDYGKWTPEGDAALGMKKGHLSFTLAGEKLKGDWHLVRLKSRPKETHENWLLIKADDSFANTKTDILETAPGSVKSKRSISDNSADKSSNSRTNKISNANIGSFSKFISPALATLKDKPPSGKGWIHEVKFDGYRIQAHVAGAKVKLLTRSGLDWTTRFGSAIQAALLALDCKDVILDGELVVLSPKGVASFSLLQADLSDGRSDRLVYYIFDLLQLNSMSWMNKPLLERKVRLKKLLGSQPTTTSIRYSEDFMEHGETILAHACRMGLEGVVSKRVDQPYHSGRSLDWIKSKCKQRQEFVVIGYLKSKASRQGMSSLLVAYREHGKLKYAGKVGTGFSTKSNDDIKRQLDKLRTTQPNVDGIRRSAKEVIWVKPNLVIEVEFAAWTKGGILRHASFQGIREDKPVNEIVKETAISLLRGDVLMKQKKSTPLPMAKAALHLTNPEKLLWPKAKISKQNLLDYYSVVWPRMEPFVTNRPLSLLRAPDGIDGQLFFQKHASQGMHPAIFTLEDREDKQQHIYIRNFDGIAALVQLGAVEIHIWGSTINAINTPDEVVFDLDPDAGLSGQAIKLATLDVKKHLEELGFRPFLKTSGGKGFHVVIPLKPNAVWDEVKTFAQDFARAMAQSAPESYTATLAKKARKGRVFIDYLRNGRGSTTVAPFSARANENAAVSMPIEWQELDNGILPQSFTLASEKVTEALAQPNPWENFFRLGKTLRS